MVKAFNLFDGELDDERTEPAGFTWRAARLGPKLGGTKLGASLYELQPGERSFPYHYEYGAEEWLVVVAGRPTLRDPEGEHELRPGDVVCFPEGPEGAHQIRNDTGEPIRVLIASTQEPSGRRRLSGQRQDRDLDRERRRSAPALPDRQGGRLLGGREPRNANDPHRAAWGSSAAALLGFRSCGGANERGPVMRPAF